MVISATVTTNIIAHHHVEHLVFLLGTAINHHYWLVGDTTFYRFGRTRPNVDPKKKRRRKRSNACPDFGRKHIGCFVANICPRYTHLHSFWGRLEVEPKWADTGLLCKQPSVQLTLSYFTGISSQYLPAVNTFTKLQTVLLGLILMINLGICWLCCSP